MFLSVFDRSTSLRSLLSLLTWNHMATRSRGRSDPCKLPRPLHLDRDSMFNKQSRSRSCTMRRSEERALETSWRSCKPAHERRR